MQQILAATCLSNDGASTLLQDPDKLLAVLHMVHQPGQDAHDQDSSCAVLSAVLAQLQKDVLDGETGQLEVGHCANMRQFGKLPYAIVLSCAQPHVVVSTYLENSEAAKRLAWIVGHIRVNPANNQQHLDRLHMLDELICCMLRLLQHKRCFLKSALLQGHMCDACASSPTMDRILYLHPSLNWNAVTWPGNDCLCMQVALPSLAYDSSVAGAAAKLHEEA